MEPATGETVATLRGHQDAIRDIRFSPDGTLVGSVSDDGELIVWDTATGRPLERWDTFDPWGVGFSPDNDLVYGGGGDSMLRTWDLSVEDTYLQQTTQVGDAEVFAHADISPDGQQVAYRWLDEHGHGMGQVRRHRHRRSDARRPASRVKEAAWPLGTWHPEGGQYAAYCVRRVRRAEHRHRESSTPPRASSSGSRDVVDGDGRLWSLAYVDEGRSLLAGDTTDRTLIVDAETLRPRGEPFDVRRALLRHPDRGREHRDGLRGLRRRRSPSTGG